MTKQPLEAKRDQHITNCFGPRDPARKSTQYSDTSCQLLLLVLSFGCACVFFPNWRFSRIHSVSGSHVGSWTLLGMRKKKRSWVTHTYKQTDFKCAHRPFRIVVPVLLTNDKKDRHTCARQPDSRSFWRQVRIVKPQECDRTVRRESVCRMHAPQDARCAAWTSNLPSTKVLFPFSSCQFQSRGVTRQTSRAVICFFSANL